MKNVSISIPYGEKSIDIELPEGNILRIQSLPDLPKLKDEVGEVTDALRKPIACDGLPELVKPTDKVVIVSDDYTRITPVSLIIPICLDELNRAGVEDGDISVLVALGTHRSMNEKELRAKFGKEVLDRVEVKNHDFRDREGLVDLGSTTNGTPISVNRQVMKADFVIGLGNIVPHHIPGWAGGAKIIQPGVCGEATIAGTHLLGVRQPTGLIGQTENLVRAELETIAHKAELKMIVNTVHNRDGELSKVVAGDMAKAFRKGVEYARKVCEVQLPARADIVVSGSHPCDLDFWQAGKSLYSSDLAVKDNGTIIIVTPCVEGVSRAHPEIIDFAGLPSEEIDRRARTGEIGDGTAASLAIAWARVRERAEVITLSEGMSPDDSRRLGHRSADTVDEALAMAFKRHGLRARVAVLTRAPEVLPIIRRAS